MGPRPSMPVLGSRLWNIQAQRCLINAEHRASGAFVNGAREKICVQSKPPTVYCCCFNYIQLVSPVLVERQTKVVCTCMHTQTHNPHKGGKEKRKSMPSIHNVAPDWLAGNLQSQWCQQPKSLQAPNFSFRKKKKGKETGMQALLCLRNGCEIKS